ncbi:hypothetical protein QYE76_016841 [Lolium multiflorum]|uniref:Uncharacterized protein n=1 Tax=Lolium multiflorum TaxID=4521 RepID=A0AAD8QIZ2_LOLMU|nr:hypothetical protein QYE76_016841 [Lolium multiflorum]
MADTEGSMESTGRSPPPAPARRGGVRWRGWSMPSSARCRTQCMRDVEAHAETEEEADAVVRARWRHEKLYDKAMILCCVMASEEERATMAEPISWRPVLDPKVSMEDHVRILRAQVDAHASPMPQPSPVAP